MSYTKLSNKSLSEWYLLLAQQLDAGVTLSQAIQLAGVINSSNRHDLVAALESGTEASEVFERWAPWMPVVDRSLIAAANTAGKLPETLTNLSIRRNAMAENMSRAIGATVYPIFIVHLAAAVCPIFNLLDFSSGQLIIRVDRYLESVIPAIAVAWSLIAIVWVLLKQNNPKVLGWLPIIRHYSALQAIADFSSLLGAFLKAGATFETAWGQAGQASKSDALKELALKVSDSARMGVQPGTLLNPKSGPLPPEFVSLYLSGEQTGQLEKNLDLLARLFQEKANQKLKQASEWYPIVIFLAVAVYVGWGMVKFYTQYLDILMSVLKPGSTIHKF